MTEQQLDLLERPAGLAAEPGAGSAEVVGGKIPEIEIPGILASRSPSTAFSVNPWELTAPSLVDAPKERPGFESRQQKSIGPGAA